MCVCFSGWISRLLEVIKISHGVASPRCEVAAVSPLRFLCDSADTSHSAPAAAIWPTGVSPGADIAKGSNYDGPQTMRRTMLLNSRVSERVDSSPGMCEVTALTIVAVAGM